MSKRGFLPSLRCGDCDGIKAEATVWRVANGDVALGRTNNSGLFARSDPRDRVSERGGSRGLHFHKHKAVAVLDNEIQFVAGLG